MNRRLFAMLGLLSALCVGPTALRADDDDDEDRHEKKKQKAATGLTIPVSGFVTPTGGTRTAATGTFTIREFDRSGEHINAMGTLVLSYSTAQGLRTVASAVSIRLESLTSGNDPVTRASSVSLSAAEVHARACETLTLRFGAIHLELIGVVADLVPIVLDIATQPGADDSSLGSHLCAIGEMLNPGRSLTEVTPVLKLLNLVLAEM